MVEQSSAPPEFRAIDSLNNASLGFNFLENKIRVIDLGNVLSQYRKVLRDELSDWPNTLSEQTLITADVHSIEIKNANNVIILVAKCDPSVDSDVIRSWLGIAVDSWSWFTQNPDAARSLEFCSSRAVNNVIRSFRAQAQQGHSEAPFEVSYIVDEIARISRAVEEGKGATGKIAFTAEHGPSKTVITNEQVFEGGSSISYGQVPEPMNVLATLQKPVRLNDHKHIVKSLQLVKSFGCLWADQNGLRGVVADAPHDSLLAEFNRGIVHLSYDSKPVCRIVNGEICYVLKEPKALLAPWLGNEGTCNDLVMSVIQSCRRERHGGTLALVPQVPKFAMTGQKLDTVISGPEKFIGHMSSVDGALLLDFDGKVYGYGYILDGDADPETERLSRGARFNSGLRFSKRIPDGYVLVISEDGPLTLFQNGQVKYADPLSELDPLRVPERDYDNGMDLELWAQLPELIESAHSS